MDPDQLLKELRELVQEVRESPLNAQEESLMDLAEKFENLDEWLSKGGFLPEDWRS